MWLKKFWDFCLDILFPPACLACEKILDKNAQTSWLCLSCRNELKLATALSCATCGARLASGKALCHQQNQYRLGAACEYSDPIAKAIIWQLKYRHKTLAAQIMAEILADYCQNLPITFTEFFFVPIPMHSKRKRQRGYNQAELIAQELGVKLKAPVRQVLKKILFKRRQTEMPDWQAREINILDTFSLAEKVVPEKIILVDDVTTSGATFAEASKILKAAGAKEIIALAFARAR